MDYMYNACSTTARRGALDWAPIFEKANLPVFEKLYESVKNGTETRKSLEFNGRKTYREDLARELKEIDDQEIWRAGGLSHIPYCQCNEYLAELFFCKAKLCGHCVLIISLRHNRRDVVYLMIKARSCTSHTVVSLH